MISPAMIYSRNGEHLTESFEKCFLKPYFDTVAKPPVWTNGWGNTHGVDPSVEITQEKADADLRANIQNAVHVVNRLVDVPVSQDQFDALVDFVFNAGEGNFAKSTMLRVLNEGFYAAARAEFFKWDMAGGAHVAGLANRREGEVAVWDGQEAAA